MLKALSNPVIAFLISPIPVVVVILLLERGFDFGVMEVFAREMPFVYLVMLVFGWPFSLISKKIGCNGYWCASILISVVIFVGLVAITYMAFSTRGIQDVVYGDEVVVMAGGITREGRAYILVHSGWQAIAAGVITFLFKFLTQSAGKKSHR